MSKLRGAELQQLWFVGEAVRAESLFSKYAELLLTPWRPLRYPHPHPPLRRSLIMVGNESGHLCKCHNGIFLLSPLIWQHATCFFTGVCSCCFLINSLADILLAGSFFFFFFWLRLPERVKRERQRKKKGGRVIWLRQSFPTRWSEAERQEHVSLAATTLLLFPV